MGAKGRAHVRIKTRAMLITQRVQLSHSLRDPGITASSHRRMVGDKMMTEKYMFLGHNVRAVEKFEKFQESLDTFFFFFFSLPQNSRHSNPN